VRVSRFVIGLDLGQAAEPTGLAVVERLEHSQDHPHSYAVRHLRRFVPGTHYAAIATGVNAVVCEGRLGHPAVVADLTAVGVGLLRPLRSKVEHARVEPVVVTAGQSPAEVDGVWQAPKRDLVTTLQLLLQDRRLAVAAGIPEALLLVREMTAFRAKVAASSDLLDWRERPEDDLVLAVALACWWGERHPPWSASDFVFSEPSVLQRELDRVFPPLPPPPELRW
jgi:hypothetical protein